MTINKVNTLGNKLNAVSQFLYDELSIDNNKKSKQYKFLKQFYADFNNLTSKLTFSKTVTKNN